MATQVHTYVAIKHTKLWCHAEDEPTSSKLEHEGLEDVRRRRKRSCEDAGFDSMVNLLEKCAIIHGTSFDKYALFSDEPSLKKSKRVVAEDLVSAMFSGVDLDLFSDFEDLSCSSTPSGCSDDYFLRDDQSDTTECLFQ